MNEVRKGWYTLQSKPSYVPVVGEKLEALAAIFNVSYRNARYCLWDLNWLNEFTVHQFNQQMLLFEAEKDLQESLAHHLNDRGYPILWALKGTHLAVHQEMVIVLPLISRAPVQTIKAGHATLMLPTLEKMLVDIYQDEKIFYFVQGAEMERILEHAIARYNINYSTLFSYAKRRGKEQELRHFLTNNFPEQLQLTGP